MTWTNCTFDNAYKLLGKVPCEIERWGVTRTYLTRHGAGPLPGEGKLKHITDEHNTTGKWQGSFRVAPLSMDLLGYASAILKGIDYVSLTHLDKLPASMDEIEDATAAKILLVSNGPTYKDKLDGREAEADSTGRIVRYDRAHQDRSDDRVLV